MYVISDCYKTLLCLLGALVIYPPGVFSNTITLNAPFSQVYEGGTATFSITSPLPSFTISAVRWTVNEVPVNKRSDLSAAVSGVGERTVDLTISNVSVAYNGSIVTCSAIINDVNFSCTPEALLLVQGILGPAEKLPQQYDALSNTVNISWTPPSAMIIPEFGRNIDRPEIYYCVQIAGPTIRSIGCNRTGDRNEDNSILIDNATCTVEYNVTIIPFNRLGDGAAITIQFPAAPEILNPGTPQLNGNNINYTYEVSGLACSCRIENQNIGSNSQCEIDMVNPIQLTVTLVDPTFNRIFNPTLFAVNSRTSSSETVELSTFDAFNLVISGSTSQLNYSLVFIEGSNARGVFVALLFRTNQITNFNQSLYFVQSVSGAQMNNQISLLSAGSYIALAYDVEETGEITSDGAADQENLMVAGPNGAGNDPFIFFGEDVNCTSNVTMDRIAVSVTCEYSTTTYSGYRAYIQDEATPTLSFVQSDESGSTVIISTVANGDYLVFVYPIWRSSSAVPDQRIAPAHRREHTISGHVATVTPTTDEDTTPDSSQQETSSTASSSDSSDTTTIDDGAVISSGGLANMEIVIGVTVAMVVVIIIVVLCIVLLVVFLVRWKKRRKSVFTATEENAFIMSDRDSKRTPSDSEILPVYATTGPPPNKPNNEPVKANGSDAPSSENASTPSGNTALYSTVNLDKKKQEREAKNGSQKDKKGKNTNDIPPPSEAAPVEPTANLYATVGNSQKETQEQTHQESQYETVQLKLPKPAQEKVEDEHLVQYSTIDHLKKAVPEPKKETPKPESVEKPHVDDKIYIRREDCYAVLGGVAARWKEFALLVGASEDYIDEIDCNNSSEYGCLDHFLLMTVKHRSREDISVALVKMGLTDEAQAILQLPSAK